MSASEPLAKPSGITLRAHRQHVYDEAVHLLDARPFLEAKYQQVTGEDLRRATLQAALWHDIGKDDRIGWQDACRRDYEEYRIWRRINGLDPDTLDAGDYGRYERYCRRIHKNPGAHLLAFTKRTGFRHEFESVRKMLAQKDDVFSIVEQVAVAAHHGHLSYRPCDRERWERKCSGRFNDIWEAFKREDFLHAWRSPTEWRDKLIARYRFAGPRSLLQLADTRASRDESGGWVPKIEATNPFPYSFPYADKRGVQREVERLWNQPIGMLRAPTGSGKTDAALLWIKHQVESGRADRGIIAMPTRFTSNALELNIRQNVSETGLYHSSAWYNRFGNTKGKEKDNAREQHKLARLLISPVTVTTVDHLLIALTGTREDHHAIFFHLAHAAVVFDEVDFYDPFVQANLTVLLEALRAFDVPVLLMSATLPESSRALYQVIGPIIEADEEPRTSKRQLAWAGEVEIMVNEERRVHLPDTVEAILRDMVERGTGIVYANTVLRAWRYRQWFEQNGVDPDDIVLYHSRFTEPDKAEIEHRLLALLGKDAWKERRAKGFAILTQIGEMSVNISAPLMLSEACPWDRLAQRAGRNGRFDMEGDSTLHVALPVRNGTVYPAPYGTYTKNQGWMPSDAFECTVNRLRGLLEGQGAIDIQASFFVDEVNHLYDQAPTFTGSAEDNRLRLREWMREAWMIVPARQTDEDEGTLEGQWRSRDIDPHVTVFVHLPEDETDNAEVPLFRFESWDDYRGFALESGISIPIYLRERELRRETGSRLTPIRVLIGDDQESQVIWYTNRYNNRDGLAWLDDQYGEPDDNRSNFV